jgi:hypothetical protein
MNTTTRRGSVYLAVLFVVLTVSVLTLTGVTLRRMMIERSDSGANAAAARRLALSGAELIVQQGKTNEASFMSAAVTGTMLPTLSLAPGTLRATVKDADTGSTPTSGTINFDIVADGRVGDARSRLGFSMENPDDELRLWIQSEPSALAYWPMDEENVTTAEEIINNFDGTYYKSSTAGVFQHVHKNRAPRMAWMDEFVTAPNRGAYQMPNGTLAFWVLFNTKPNTPNWDATAVSKANTSVKLGMETTLRVFLDRSDLKFSMLTSSGGGTIAFSQSKIVQGQWHHVAVSWGSAGMVLYLDGKREANNTGVTLGLNGSIVPLRAPNLFDWIFGGYKGSSGTVYEPLYGSVARVALFTRQLTEDEIAAMMALDSRRPGPRLKPETFARVVD